jgi:DNA replication protein DnaC
MNNELYKMLKYLRRRGLLENYDQYLAMAGKKRFSHGRLLEHVIKEEYELRRRNAHQLRLTKAKIPERFVIETYPFEQQPKLNKKRILNLYDAFEYMRHNQNIIWLGPTGCGKTGLATSFLIHAIDQGHTGRYVTFAELINELYRAVADYSEPKVIRKYLSYDCLQIDEIGYVEVEPVQVGLFFTLMQKRHKKKTTLITSNLGFAEWGKSLKNDHLTAALIDRLTETSHVINMKNCRSIRPTLDPDSGPSKNKTTPKETT